MHREGVLNRLHFILSVVEVDFLISVHQSGQQIASVLSVGILTDGKRNINRISGISIDGSNQVFLQFIGSTLDIVMHREGVLSGGGRGGGLGGGNRGDDKVQGMGSRIVGDVVSEGGSPVGGIGRVAHKVGIRSIQRDRIGEGVGGGASRLILGHVGRRGVRENPGEAAPILCKGDDASIHQCLHVAQSDEIAHGVRNRQAGGLGGDGLGDLAKELGKILHFVGEEEVLLSVADDALHGLEGVLVLLLIRAAQVDAVDLGAILLGDLGFGNGGIAVGLEDVLDGDIVSFLPPMILAGTSDIGVVIVPEIIPIAIGAAAADSIVIIKVPGASQLILIHHMSSPIHVTLGDLSGVDITIAVGRHTIGEDHDDLLAGETVVFQKPLGLMDTSLDVGAAIIVILISLGGALDPAVELLHIVAEGRARVRLRAEADHGDAVAVVVPSVVTLQQGADEGLGGLPGICKTAGILFHAVGAIHHQDDVGRVIGDGGLLGLLDGDAEVDIELVVRLVRGRLLDGDQARVVAHLCALLDNTVIRDLLHGKCRDLHQAQAHYQGHEQAQCPLADGLAPGDSLARIVICHDSFPPSIFNRN